MPRIFYFVQRMIRYANQSFRSRLLACGCRIVGPETSKSTMPNRINSDDNPPVVSGLRRGIHCLSE